MTFALGFLRLISFTTALIRIFGAITSADVAEALAAKGVEVDKKNISVEGIKTVGEYKATVKLHREVKAEVALTVVAE